VRAFGLWRGVFTDIINISLVWAVTLLDIISQIGESDVSWPSQ